MDFTVDDRDLAAFLIYAARERSLDASAQSVGRFSRVEDHRASIEALRELNRRMLIRETRRDDRFLG
jgi:hypothetical protein